MAKWLKNWTLCLKENLNLSQINHALSLPIFTIGSGGTETKKNASSSSGNENVFSSSNFEHMSNSSLNDRHQNHKHL